MADSLTLDDSIVYTGTVKMEAKDDADVPAVLSLKKEEHHNASAGSDSYMGDDSASTVGSPRDYTAQLIELYGRRNTGIASNELEQVQTSATEAPLVVKPEPIIKDEP